jgi:ankyrin repeat protein
MKHDWEGFMIWRALISGFLWALAAAAQVPEKIDFKRDVQPILREHCTGCHGAVQQMGHFRLDRRRDAMRGGSIAVIAPGSSSGSRLYHKITGTAYGPQMPPTGPLSADNIEIIKRWLDQGAPWPDDVSGETPPSPADPVATRMMEALRTGDLAAFRKILAAKGTNIAGKGAAGSTPLMYAALYGDAAAVGALLQSGADPNSPNEAGATALMWAVADVEKTRLLLEAGADVNARSSDGQTALSIASGRFGSVNVVKLLLGKGAKPSVSERAPLSQAAAVGDPYMVRVLLDSAKEKGAGLPAAIRGGCESCFALLLKHAKPEDLSRGLRASAQAGDVTAFRKLLDLGARIPDPEPDGLTTLMRVVSMETAPVQIVMDLIHRGEDSSAKTNTGETALDFALRHGETAVVRFLKETKARQGATFTNPRVQPKAAASVRAALERSLPLLDRADETTLRQSGCVTCHHNSLTSMTQAAARKMGIPVNEEAGRRQRDTLAPYFESWRERALQGIGIPGNQDTVSYLLIGAAAAGYPPDPATDALAYYLKGRQRADGAWSMQTHRPPIESSNIQVTAASMRALQYYAPKPMKPDYDRAILSAASWLATARPVTTEDRAFQLLGLAWAGSDPRLADHAGKALLAGQRDDGGWAQLPSLASDAYATGQAMVALRESGVLAATAPAYERAVRFLLSTQFEDGSWFVRSRAIPFQPYAETGFPFGKDQWISAAATNWAAMGLAMALR